MSEWRPHVPIEEPCPSCSDLKAEVERLKRERDEARSFGEGMVKTASEERNRAVAERDSLAARVAELEETMGHSIRILDAGAVRTADAKPWITLRMKQEADRLRSALTPEEAPKECTHHYVDGICKHCGDDY